MFRKSEIDRIDRYHSNTIGNNFEKVVVFNLGLIIVFYNWVDEKANECVAGVAPNG